MYFPSTGTFLCTTIYYNSVQPSYILCITQISFIIPQTSFIAPFLPDQIQSRFKHCIWLLCFCGFPSVEPSFQYSLFLIMVNPLKSSGQLSYRTSHILDPGQIFQFSNFIRLLLITSHHIRMHIKCTGHVAVVDIFVNGMTTVLALYIRVRFPFIF